MSCFYCEKDERLLALMTPLTELQWSDVYLFNDQKHKGRCVVAVAARARWQTARVPCQI